MLEKMIDRMRDERGVALITAMLMSMVVVTLGATSVTLALHNSEQSGFDRRRVQGIAAAEAGLNYYYSHLQSEPASNLLCTITKDLSTTPASRFTATATYYSAAGLSANPQQPLPCVGNPPRLQSGSNPVSVRIASVGRSANDPMPSRTMETYVTLSPISESPFADTVIFSNNSFTWPANINIRGADASNNSVYTNGNANFNSSTTIYGSVYAQGQINMRGSSQIRRDAWANLELSMANNSSVLGNGISSTRSVTLTQGAKIYGNAQAGTSISGGSTAILGTRMPNSPQGPPPVKAFPTFDYNPSHWIQAGYQISNQNASCSSAKSTIKNITSGNWVVRIPLDCELRFEKRDAPTIRGNLAIISDGGMFVDTNNFFNAVGGPWNLHLIFGIDNDGQPCNITWKNNTAIGTNVNAFFYTPCTVSFQSNMSIASGQIFGGTVSLSPSTSIGYKTVPIPGAGTSGFRENIQYIREIVTTTT